MLIDKTIAPFTLLLGPIVLAAGDGGRPLAAGGWRCWPGGTLSRALKIWPHLRRRPADWLILPIFIVVTYYMSLVKAYALFTINEHKWLTRAVAMVDGEVVRVVETAQ